MATFLADKSALTRRDARSEVRAVLEPLLIAGEIATCGIVDLELLYSASGRATYRALAEALRDHGDVHASATDYRTAVRRELFAGMGEQRYESLLSALLQLRQPKLSERLDPSLLSTLLSRALPPLGEGEISELAEGFERLDRQREHLKRLDGEVAAAETVASRQRAYARRVLRAGAATLISATTEMDDLTRAARQSAEELEQALRERESAQAWREEQELRAWQGDRLVLETRVSSGRPGHDTPTGSFTAGPLKRPMLISKKYNDAEMPWSVQVRGDVVIHGYPSVPPRAASHGCVRLPLTGANPAHWFYTWVETGTPIEIADDWLESPVP